MASRSRKNGVSNANNNRGVKKSALEFSDEEGSEEEDSPLSTRRAAPRSGRTGHVGRMTRGGATGGASRADYDDDEDEDESHRPSHAHGDDDDDSEGDDDDDDDDGHDSHGRKLMGLQHPPVPYSAGSYLPTAYGGAPGGPEMALMGGQPSQRERSVDRIRARSRDRRRDISKERHVRDRSRSQSQSRNQTENQKAADRAAERRRNRRASLEMSLGMMSMDDSASSFDQGSVFSTASNQQSAMSLVSGMDSSFSQNLDHAPNSATSRRSQRAPGRTPISASLRDSTSTDFTADRRRQVYKSGKPSKTWDGRLDHVLNRRRSTGGASGVDGGSVATSNSRSLSPTAGAGKEKRGGRRTNASAR